MTPPILQHVSHGNVLLGCNPRLNLKALPLSNYVKASDMAHPPVCAWERPIDWKMFGNGPDTLNGQPFAGAADCVIAWMFHHTMAMRAVAHAGSPEEFTTEQVIKAYSDITGYVAGDLNTDRGSYPDDALDYWQKTGVVGHKIDGYVNLDISNVDQLRYAMYNFCGIGFSMETPLYVMEVPKGGSWSYAKGKDKTNCGGHQIYLVGYGRQGFRGVSWGAEYTFNVDFVGQFGRMAQAVVSEDWIKQSGKSPSGLDLTGLLLDLRSL